MKTPARGRPKRLGYGLLSGFAFCSGFPGSCLIGFCLSIAWCASPSAGKTKNQATSSSPREFRAFDDAHFTLAYDVFLAARNVKSAFDLARDAVRQKPELAAWRERLARTAEWAGEPRLALQEWEYLGNRMRRADAFREAIRLATALRDHAAAVRAWEGLANLRELTAEEWLLLADAYEQSGMATRCVERLQKRVEMQPDRKVMLRLAEVLTHTDRDQEALAVLGKAAGLFGNSTEITLRRVEILCRSGRIREAAPLLDAAQGLPAEEKERARFLRLQASVYSWLQRYGDALQAYRRLFAEEKYDAADLREISAIARQADPELALRAAIAGWIRFRDPDHIIYYLERCIEADRWDLASRLLARLTPEHWAICRQATYFHVLAARIHQREGRTALARSEYLHALEREPASEDFQSGYLWLLIEQGRLPELARYADKLGRGAATPKPLIEPLAMAYKLLQRHDKALAYFRLLDQGQGLSDFPFLLAYAEMLEQTGDGHQAERVFRRAHTARISPAVGEEEKRSRDWLESSARWSQRFGSSDETEQRIAALIERRQGGDGAKELAFSWRVARGQNPEDAMTAVGGAGQGKKAFPAWARLAVAMRTDDMAQISSLLENRESGLGDEDRARAASFLGRHKEAERHARRGRLGKSWSSALGDGQGRVGLPGLSGGVDWDDHPQYQERRYFMEAQSPLSDDVLWVATAEMRERPWISTRLTTAVPTGEKAGKLELRLGKARHRTRLALGLRSTSGLSTLADSLPSPKESNTTVTTFSGEQEWRPRRQVSVIVGYDGNALAEENPVLALIGKKDRWRSMLRMNLPANTDAELFFSRAFYQSWEETKLGDSYHMKTLVQRRFLPLLSTGVALAYNRFSVAPYLQTFWHTSAHAEWLARAPSSALWSCSPMGSLEVGRNFFPATATSESSSAHEFAVRSGVVMNLGVGRRLQLLGEYARGLQGRDETESGLSLNYDHTFR